MVKYTFKDVRALASELSHYFKDPDVGMWLEVAEGVKKEFSDTKEMILELLGPYVFTFTREYSKKIGLTDLIFNTPVKLMPLYIGSEDRPWEMVVARWRLTIQK